MNDLDASRDDERESLAARGFAHADAYAAARPGYPDDAVRHLVQSLHLAGSTVVDVGAGTGIFTRQIAPWCARVLAVEPSAGMRERFTHASPDLEVRDGRGDHLPFEDATVDAITVAQAFHWFEPDAALAEFARVLRPGGRLGLIWNERDESVPWVAAMSHAMHWDTRAPYPVGMDFTPVLTAGPFTDVDYRVFHHTQRLTRELLDQRVLSTSYIAVMSPDEQARILRDVRAVVADFGDDIALPYVTSTYGAWLVDRAST